MSKTSKYILSIDQGTTGSTALLLDEKGEIKASSNVSFKQIYLKDGWVEHDPKDILKSVKTSISSAIRKAKISASNIKGIGITNQRETVVFWNKKTGKTYGNAIVWQCRRTSDFTNKLKRDGHEAWIKKETGLALDPYFSASKILWFLKKIKGSKKDLIFGTIDSYLIWSLTKGESFVTEPSNASRTMLFSLKTQTWDKKLLDFFKVDEKHLAKIIPSNGDFGSVKGFSPLKDGTPIRAVLGDQQSSLYGHKALKSGDAKCTFGTGSFILMNTGDKKVQSKNGLLTTVAWSLKDKKTTFALEGGAFNCASCINWFVKNLGVIKKPEDIGREAMKVKDTFGLLFSPTFSGLGAPYWCADSRGAFVGLNLGVEKTHLCRAVLEGLSYQNELIFNALEKDAKQKITKIFVDGGASKSDEFMKIQSQFSKKRLIRPKSIETTALGVAMLAGESLGIYKGSSLKSFNTADVEFKSKQNSSVKKRLSEYDNLFKSLDKRPFATI